MAGRIGRLGIRYCRLTWHMARIGWVIATEYRTNLILGLISTLVLQATSILLVAVVLGTFGTIASWTVPAMALLLGLRSLSHGLFVFLFNGLRRVARVIRQGDLDRLLLRPVHPLFQLAYGGQIEVRGLGDLIAGAAYLVFASHGLGLRWNLLLALMLVLVTVSGVVIEGSVYLASGIIGFWTMQDAPVRQVAWLLHENFILYPISIYGPALTFLVTIVVPFGFVNYYPAGIFLAASAAQLPAGVVPALGYLCVPVAMACGGLSIWLWGRASGRYVSTGS